MFNEPALGGQDFLRHVRAIVQDQLLIRKLSKDVQMNRTAIAIHAVIENRLEVVEQVVINILHAQIVKMLREDRLDLLFVFSSCLLLL